MSATDSATLETPPLMAVESTALFGFCRDCRHWQATTQTRERLAEYPRNKHPDDGWLDAVCNRIKRGIQITASGGWEGASVDSVETDANFGCVYFEQNEKAHVSEVSNSERRIK
jgi:hypothetical protein